MNVQIIVPIVLFIAIFGVIYVIVSAWNKKNIAMIEAGMHPDGKEVMQKKSHSKLRFGLLLICVPIGILVGNLTHASFNIGSDVSAVIFAFLFGGVALTATYFIEYMDKDSAEK